MTTASPELKTASLYFTSGSSDKEYHARIEAQGDGFIVSFRYGRRGASLTAGTKTATPVPYEKALAIFEKLVRDKTSKGYTPGADGTPYQGGDKAGQVSGLLPQLLTVLDDAQVSAILDDPAWCMQEKFDGRRVLLRKTAGSVHDRDFGTVTTCTVEAINKLGLVVAASAAIVDSVVAIPGDVVLDGEAIGDRYVAFDLLSRDGDDLTGKPYRDRYAALVGLLGSGGGALAVAQCWTSSDMAVELAALRERNAEGAVFKRLDAPYTAGRPASGGPQRKYKFVESCSVVVSAVNDGRRSVAVSLLDGEEWTPMGNVTIPANHAVPNAGDVVEVRYLYALKGGSLYQPVYLGARDDIEPRECVVGQLKHKAE